LSQSGRTFDLPTEIPILPPERPTALKPKDIKIEKPDIFTGACLKLQLFFSQLEITFILSLNWFTDNKTKVLYTISLLRDEAFNWVQLMLWMTWESPPPPKLQSFTAFRNTLEKMFGDFDAEAAAERKLKKLQQTANTRTYLSEFWQTVSHLLWGNEALAFKFYTSLKETVKDRIVKQGRLKNLAELIQLAVWIDDCQYERQLE
jgi:hypothetical protein